MPDFQPFSEADLYLLPTVTPQDWGDITPAFKQYVARDFCTPVKLMDSTRLIGVGAAMYHGSTGWLGHIIVHPDYRQQGYGAMITKHLMDILMAKHVKTILLIATELGQPVYAKLGFIPETQYIFYRWEGERSDLISTDSIIPYDRFYHDQVLILDKIISGEDRRPWLEPELDSAYLFVDHGDLRGFYLPGLGDGLIYALDQAAGHALMDRRFREQSQTVIPADNVYATSLMDRRQAVIHRTARRMWYGLRHVWKPECVYNRISGALG